MIWLQGWDVRPEFGRHYAKSWEEFHPQWNVYHWDEKSLWAAFADYLTEGMRHALESLPEIVHKVDLWRLIILYFMGGVYVDLDFVCLDNFEEYLDKYEFVASVEHDGIIANGFIGSVTGHILLVKGIDHIATVGLQNIQDMHNDNMHNNSKDYVLKTTGPHAMSDVWKTHLDNNQQNDNIHIETNDQVFFPFKYEEYNVSKLINDDVATLKRTYPKSKAVHMYWGSWTYNKQLF